MPLPLKTTFHSTIFDIPMRPLKKARNSSDGNYSFEFCPLHAARA